MRSNEWAEWHLTPRGWVCGSSRLDGSRRELREPAADRVRSVTYREHKGGPSDVLKSTHTPTWEGDPVLAAELEAEYGPAPDGFGGGPPLHPPALSPAQEHDVLALRAELRGHAGLADLAALPSRDRLMRLAADPALGPRLARLRTSGLTDAAIAAALFVPRPA